jgi:transposase-like protein
MKGCKMQRKRYDSATKAKVVLKLISGHQTAIEIAKQYGVHPIMLAKWKKQAIDLFPKLFDRKVDKDQEEWKVREAQMFQQIGQLQYELDWLKKKTAAYD